MNVNKVILAGNLTRDPELRALASGTQVCEFGIAINENYKDKNGQKVDKTCFLDCVAWGRTAELVAEHFTKGRPIFIEGSLQLDQWQTKEGEKRSKVRVRVERMQFVDRRRDQDSGDDQQATPPPRPAGTQSVAVDDMEDRLPF